MSACCELLYRGYDARLSVSKLMLQCSSHRHLVSLGQFRASLAKRWAGDGVLHSPAAALAPLAGGGGLAVIRAGGLLASTATPAAEANCPNRTI